MLAHRLNLKKSVLKKKTGKKDNPFFSLQSEIQLCPKAPSPCLALFFFDGVSKLVLLLQCFYFIFVVLNKGGSVHTLALLFVLVHDFHQLAPALVGLFIVFINADDEFSMFWNTRFHIVRFPFLSPANRGVFVLTIVARHERFVKYRFFKFIFAKCLSAKGAVLFVKIKMLLFCFECGASRRKAKKPFGFIPAFFKKSVHFFVFRNALTHTLAKILQS